MIFWFILSSVSGIMAYCFGKKKDEKEGYISKTESFGYPFLTLIAIIAIFTASHLTVNIFANVHKEVYNSQKIIALNDNMNTQGQFFLGSGSVNGEMKYYYMIDENGLYRMESINVENVQLKYSNETKIEILRDKYDNEIFTFLWGDPVTRDEYIISIPKGSIKQDFNVDLK